MLQLSPAQHADATSRCSWSVGTGWWPRTGRRWRRCTRESSCPAARCPSPSTPEEVRGGALHPTALLGPGGHFCANGSLNDWCSSALPSHRATAIPNLCFNQLMLSQFSVFAGNIPCFAQLVALELVLYPHFPCMMQLTKGEINIYPPLQKITARVLLEILHCVPRRYFLEKAI